MNEGDDNRRVSFKNREKERPVQLICSCFTSSVTTHTPIHTDRLATATTTTFDHAHVTHTGSNCGLKFFTLFIMNLKYRLYTIPQFFNQLKSDYLSLHTPIDHRNQDVDVWKWNITQVE